MTAAISQLSLFGGPAVPVAEVVVPPEPAEVLVAEAEEFSREPDLATDFANTAQPEMFGAAEVGTEFRTALQRYGVWPTTVWDCDMSDPKTRRLKQLIGDVESQTAREIAAIGGAPTYQMTQSVNAQRKRQSAELERLERLGYGTTREGAFTMPTIDLSVYRWKVTASIFNPAVAAWLLNCFAPSEGLCFNPFAGGGTRAIMAAKHGLRYLGMELRLAEVQAVQKRLAAVGIPDEQVTIALGDSRVCLGVIGGRIADFLMTCPPYHDLEQYEGGEGDLSGCATYAELLDGMRDVIAQTRRILKPNVTSCWVVGLHRDKRGSLLPLHHDIARLHTEQGFRLREEVILNQRNNGAIQRIGNFNKGDRRLVRMHEYALIFQSPTVAA